MSNSLAFGLKSDSWIDAPEPATRLVNMNHLGRALTEYHDPPVEMLFVYNCNPAGDHAGSEPRAGGLEREDLFTVVFEQVFTDTARYADVVLAGDDVLRALRHGKGLRADRAAAVRPVIEPRGEARSNAQVFSAMAERLGVGRAEEETETLMRIAGGWPSGVGARTARARRRHAAARRRARSSSWTSSRAPPDRKVNLFPAAVAGDAPAGLYGYQADPATERFPLALISPATRNRFLDARRTARAGRAAAHPSLRRRPRGIAQSDPVRVFNGLGEFHCPANLTADVRRGTVAFPKGSGARTPTTDRRRTRVVPDSLTDLGGGACFNDARVQVALLGRH